MPTHERVRAFIAAIERGEFLESIPEFYAEDMTAQENQEPPRIGRAAQLENEKRTLARVTFESARAESVAVDGDLVAIQWRFEMSVAGGRMVLEEVALQRWRGERIQAERYFYDPAQRAMLRR